MQWQFLREVRAGQEKIKTRKKTVTDGCDCLFNYKLIIKNIYFTSTPFFKVLHFIIKRDSFVYLICLFIF